MDKKPQPVLPARCPKCAATVYLARPLQALRRNTDGLITDAEQMWRWMDSETMGPHACIHGWEA